jgi:putative hemolysin
MGAKNAVLAVGALVILFAFYGCTQTDGTQGLANGTQGVIVGNDSDIHGCKGSAGYSWCAATQKCIRVWEENCTASNGGSGIANPASVNCVDKGYNLTIKTDSEGGQYGVCSKPGYTECEEWALFRDNCSIVPLGQANGTMNATGREPRAEGQFCGGIAAIPCQERLHCRLDGTYPDAGGACIKDCSCTLMTDGTAARMITGQGRSTAQMRQRVGRLMKGRLAR